MNGLMSKGVSIIVPIYADWASISGCLVSLIKYAGRRNSILLVNDCGPEADEIEQKINALIKGRANIKYFRNSFNLGYGATCNLSVNKYDTTDNDVLLLNSDTVVTRGFIRNMKKVLNSSKAIGCVSPRSNNATVFSIPFNAETHGYYHPAESYRIYKKVKRKLPLYYVSPTAHGFCMLIKRDVIRKYGLFDSVYGKGYCEENDFSMRIRKEGYLSAIANKAYVFHLGSKSFTAKGRERLIKNNTKILNNRYPDYNSLVDSYVATVVMPEQRLLHKYFSYKSD